MKKRGQGQSWSLDIVLAFVIFILIIGIFYTILSNRKDDTKNIQLEASSIANNIEIGKGTESEMTIIYNGTVEEGKLEELFQKDYNATKNRYGIKGDFCIYIVDQEGFVVSVTTPTGTYTSFGNSNLKINNIPCGSKVS